MATTIAGAAGIHRVGVPFDYEPKVGVFVSCKLPQESEKPVLCKSLAS